jgi:histidinol-phosphatase (PHP family)
VNKFYDQSLEMVTRGGFDIIGHYDKIGNNASHFQHGIEQEDWYLDRVNQLTEAIIQSGVAVEINTKARANHGRFFPSEIHWRKLLDAGVTILVNSDAHYHDLINASRDEAFKIIEQIKTQNG